MSKSPYFAPLLLACGILLGCNDSSNSAEPAPSTPNPPATNPPVTNPPVISPSQTTFQAVKVAQFSEPWAMAFLPDGRLLVTEKKGKLKIYNIANKTTTEVSGVPEVAYGGQGGLGDIALHPKFAQNHLVYFSYIEAGTGGKGAVVARATLEENANGSGQLLDPQIIWRQVPKVSGDGHFSHRIVFDAQGKLWISSGDRQKFDPAQDMKVNLGKIIRLNDDGSIPADNPFAAQGGVTAQIWTLGHRNPLGLAFNDQGQLWEIEMGPKGGDELNLIEKGKNYGWPIVSNGDNYDDSPIPDHNTRPEFYAPAVSWTPVISPSSLTFYNGNRFPAWKGNAFISGLSAQALIRIEFDGNKAREAQRYEMGARIRAIKQGPDGSLWLLEDGEKANLVQLVPNQ